MKILNIYFENDNKIYTYIYNYYQESVFHYVARKKV
jgi:hypothetical protein